jgi:hypothetical protein
MYLYLYAFIISPGVLHVQIIVPFFMNDSNNTGHVAMYFYTEVYYTSDEGIGSNIKITFTDVLHAVSSMETFVSYPKEQNSVLTLFRYSINFFVSHSHIFTLLSHASFLSLFLTAIHNS